MCIDNAKSLKKMVMTKEVTGQQQQIQLWYKLKMQSEKIFVINDILADLIPEVSEHCYRKHLSLILGSWKFIDIPMSNSCPRPTKENSDTNIVLQNLSYNQNFLTIIQQ